MNERYIAVYKTTPATLLDMGHTFDNPAEAVTTAMALNHAYFTLITQDDYNAAARMIEATDEGVAIFKKDVDQFSQRGLVAPIDPTKAALVHSMAEAIPTQEKLELTLQDIDQLNRVNLKITYGVSST